MLKPKQNYKENYPLERKIKVVRKDLDSAYTLCTNHRVCLDIGAHIGVFAIEASSRYEMVHSFEPIPNIYKMLEENTKDIENIKTYNYVVSDSNKPVPMLENPRNTESNFAWTEDTRDLHHRKKWINERGIDVVEMPATFIDSFAFENVDFIKIDTEGYVLPVLQGMVETLKNNNALLQIEISEDKDKIVKFLKKCGYVYHSFIGKKDHYFTKM